MEFYLACRYLFRGKAKHISFIGIISCLGVIIGVATVIVAISIVNGVDGGLMQRLMRFQHHLIIESLDEGALYRAKKIIEQWPDVENAALSLRTQVFAKLDNTIVPLVVKGMDFNDEKEKFFFSQYIRRDSGGQGFFVGENLASRFFLNDVIEFYPLKKTLALQEEKIRGVFRIGLYDLDNYYLISDLEKAKELSPNYQFFLGLRIREPNSAGRIKEKVLNSIPEELFVSTWIESNQALFATLKLERIAMFIILSLIVIVASFNIFATLTIKVVEKTKDIGVLKAIGFSRKKILRIFTLQGLILGFIGVLGGSLLGIGVCYLLQKYPFIRVPEEIFFTEYLPVALDYKDIVLIGLVTLSISVVSSIFPSLKAAKLPPCEALRYE